MPRIRSVTNISYSVSIVASGTTPTRIDSGGIASRSGVIICNTTSGYIYIRLQNSSATAPTSSELTSATGFLYRIPAYETAELDIESSVAVYAVGDVVGSLAVSEYLDYGI